LETSWKPGITTSQVLDKLRHASVIANLQLRHAVTQTFRDQVTAVR